MSSTSSTTKTLNSNSNANNNSNANTKTINSNSKPENIIGSYNSLKDPHLRWHFRKPQIRRHLLQANIINKDNKIVEEISSTKHQLNIERKQKRELYQMLNELIGLNNGGGPVVDSDPEKLLNDAQVILDSGTGSLIGHRLSNNHHHHHHDQDSNNPAGNPQRTLLIQKLDRMIKAIKEHHEQASVSSRPIQHHQNGIIKSNLSKAKSQHDVTLESANQNALSESCKRFHNRSTPQLSKNSTRPKSSYGRTRKGQQNDDHSNNHHHSSPDDSPNTTTTSINKLKKCTSLANIQNRIQDGDGDDDDFVEIKSLDGESFDDSDDVSDHDQQDAYDDQKPKLPMLDANGRRSSPKHHHQQLFPVFPVSKATSKKYYAFDRRFTTKSSTTNQKVVRMTFRYNGLNTATNHGGKRNVKVFQQIHVGGNSILIYDGFVNPGETFSFNVRPHLNDSFAINVLVNGIRDLRLNTCCERKHRPGTTLSRFTIVDVVGGRACFNCRLLLGSGSTTTTSETNEFMMADDAYDDGDEYKTTIDGTNFRINGNDGLHGSTTSTNNESNRAIFQKDHHSFTQNDQEEQANQQNQSKKVMNIHLDRGFSPHTSLPRLSPPTSSNDVMAVNGQPQEQEQEQQEQLEEQNADHKTNETENHNHEISIINDNKTEQNNDHDCGNDQQHADFEPVINDNGTDLVVGMDSGQDIADETMPHVENDISTDDEYEEK